jgi:7-cyano-7-deazaguanine synthase
MNSSIILLSGGLDSAANLAIAAEKDLPTLALTVNYGQRAAQREIQSAQKLCHFYGVNHQVLDLPWLGALGGSSLTDISKTIPGIEKSQLDEKSIIENTARAVWVPNRNGVLIHIAAAIAEQQSVSTVLVGFNAEEAATFPDNSEEYMNAVNQALFFSTANQVQVKSYTVRWNKKQIVAELKKLRRSFPFDLVWSCYEGREPACRVCESCQRLARALQS